MNAANAENSDRLKRVLSALRSWGQLSTRELIRVAEVCAVNSCVSELRANGYEISCKRLGDNYYYRLETP